MFTTLSNANKETQQGLKHWATYTTNFYVINNQLRATYHLTRHITKKYQYVGLTESAAKQGVLDKIAQYTKTLKGWQFRPEDPQGPFVPVNTSTVVAEVVSQHTGGHMWSVDINVNQIDEKWTTSLPSNIESAFDAIVPSDYDE